MSHLQQTFHIVSDPDHDPDRGICNGIFTVIGLVIFIRQVIANGKKNE